MVVPSGAKQDTATKTPQMRHVCRKRVQAVTRMLVRCQTPTHALVCIAFRTTQNSITIIRLQKHCTSRTFERTVTPSSQPKGSHVAHSLLACITGPTVGLHCTHRSSAACRGLLCQGAAARRNLGRRLRRPRGRCQVLTALDADAHQVYISQHAHTVGQRITA